MNSETAVRVVLAGKDLKGTAVGDVAGIGVVAAVDN